MIGVPPPVVSSDEVLVFPVVSGGFSPCVVAVVSGGMVPIGVESASPFPAHPAIKVQKATVRRIVKKANSDFLISFFI